MSIRLQDGVVIWSTTVGGRIEATAAVSSQHGVVFVGQWLIYTLYWCLLLVGQ